MTVELFLTALITCSTGQATCGSYDMPEYTQVNVCGILNDSMQEEVPENASRSFTGMLEGQKYRVTIEPFCNTY